MATAVTTNKAISCNDGKIWSGFLLTKGGQDQSAIQTAKCGNIVAQNDIYNLKKGDQLSNLCECEVISEKNGDISCPAGKFMTDYNSTTKKATCCMLCNNDNTVKGTYDQKDCSIVFKDKNIVDVNCPNNNFLNSININSNNSKLSCCSPMLKEYDRTGTTIQTETKIQTSSDIKCKEYGLEPCSAELIKSTEAKCNQYGMRYFDSVDNKYKNTDSHMVCHVDNFAKLDTECKDNSVSSCNVYNVRQNQLSDIKRIKTDIGNIDAIQNVYEKKFSDLGIAGNKTLTITLIILGLLVTIMAIYIVLKN